MTGDIAFAAPDPAPTPSPAVLVTKLHPPTSREHTVRRERLVERLRDGNGRRLILVAAPAGSGKTTLLASWRDSESPEKRFAWVSLDEDDNDVVGLWMHIIESLCRVTPGLEESISPHLIGDARFLDVTLRQLMNVLADQDETVLILDDFHRLSSGPARDSIRWVIANAPANFRLVLATRTEPALPLAALRARGELLELRAHDLRFSSEETSVLLNDRLSLDLAQEDVDHLVGQTEGWAAGLYLAALSLASTDDRHARIDNLGASHRYIADFLTEEVLDASDPATRELMVRSSVLGRFSGSLCDAALETDGSAVRLVALSRTNLFLVPLDDDGEWFRFHHFFRQMLRMELERCEPTAPATIHRRAYEWHRRHGTTHEAIDHAIAAGEPAGAGELIEAVWMDYVNAGRQATLLSWLTRFPDEMLRSNKRLLLVKAWVLAFSGMNDEAREAVLAVEQLGASTDGSLGDDSSSVEMSLTLMRGFFSEGDVGAQLRCAQRAEELAAPGTVWHSWAVWCVGYGLYLSGEIEQARPWFEESAMLAPATGQWYAAGGSLAWLSLVAWRRGDDEQQRALAERAKALAEDHGTLKFAGEVASSYAMSSACKTLTDALPYAEQALAAYRAWGRSLDLAHGLILYATVLRRFGEHTRMAAAIAEAESILESCADPGALPAWLAELKRPLDVHVAQRNDALTDRELVVLRLLSGTLTERDIGRELYVSHSTVHSHVRSIFRKLGVSSRTAAVARGRQLGHL